MEPQPVNRTKRQDLLKQKALVIWFSGLSGSGKTTLSEALEQELNRRGFKTYILDGDKLRTGLNKDLGFSEADRTENIRRVGEVSKLMLDSGLVVLSAFISPIEKDRQMVKEMIGDEHLFRVFVDCPLEICEQRDVKGLYKKARSGELKSFTGISSPFEPPTESEIILKTAEQTKEELINELLKAIIPRITMP